MGSSGEGPALRNMDATTQRRQSWTTSPRTSQDTWLETRAAAGFGVARWTPPSTVAREMDAGSRQLARMGCSTKNSKTRAWTFILCVHARTRALSDPQEPEAEQHRPHVEVGEPGENPRESNKEELISTEIDLKDERLEPTNSPISSREGEVLGERADDIEANQRIQRNDEPKDWNAREPKQSHLNHVQSVDGKGPASLSEAINNAHGKKSAKCTTNCTPRDTNAHRAISVDPEERLELVVIVLQRRTVHFVHFQYWSEELSEEDSSFRSRLQK